MAVVWQWCWTVQATMGDVVAENVGVQMWLPSLSEVEPFDLPDGFALRRYRCDAVPQSGARLFTASPTR